MSRPNQNRFASTPALGQGSKPRERGRTRYLDNGDMEWMDPMTDQWRPAVRLADIRARLIQEEARAGSYVIEKARGFEDTNVTSYLPRDSTNGPDRANRPAILFQISCNRLPGQKPTGWVTYHTFVVLDPFDHGLRDFSELPKTLSSEVGGHDIVHWQRQNKYITIYDLLARTPNGYKEGRHGERWHEGPIGYNALSMRATRWRLAAACLSWTKRQDSEVRNGRILEIIPEMYKNPQVNSTRGFRDLTEQEQRDIEAKGVGRRPNKAKKSKRAGKKKQESGNTATKTDEDEDYEDTDEDTDEDKDEEDLDGDDRENLTEDDQDDDEEVEGDKDAEEDTYQLFSNAPDDFPRVPDARNEPETVRAGQRRRRRHDSDDTVSDSDARQFKHARTSQIISDAAALRRSPRRPKPFVRDNAFMVGYAPELEFPLSNPVIDNDKRHDIQPARKSIPRKTTRKAPRKKPTDRSTWRISEETPEELVETVSKLDSGPNAGEGPANTLPPEDGGSDLRPLGTRTMSRSVPDHGNPELDAGFRASRNLAWARGDLRFTAPLGRMSEISDSANIQKALDLARIQYHEHTGLIAPADYTEMYQDESYASQHHRLQEEFSRVWRGGPPIPLLYFIPSFTERFTVPVNLDEMGKRLEGIRSAEEQRRSEEET